jgi:hypothetical protein
VYEKDYILRIIEMAGVMLRAMLSGIREQRPAEAIATSHEALTLILGIPPALTDSLTAAGLVTLLSAGGEFDAKRGRLAAEVYVRRVQADALMGLGDTAQLDLAKALRLIRAVIESGDPDDVAEARTLQAELDRHGPFSDAGPA